MRTHLAASVLPAFLLLTPAVALAGGYQVPNTNPRDLGLANTTVSATEGAEATYVNTATLADHMGLDLTLSFAIVAFQSKWTDPTNTSITTTTKTELAVPPVAGAAYGFKVAGHGMGIGVSLNIPGGGQIFWPQSWQGNGQIISVDRRIFQSTFGVGFEVIPQLKIGASFIYMQAVEQFIQALPFGATTGRADLGLAGGRPTFAVSVEANPIPDLSIGAQYQNLAEMLLNGNVHFSNVPTPFQTTLVDQTVKQELTFPNIVTAGISYKILNRARLLFAYQFTRFIVYQSDLFTGQLTGVTVVVPRDYHNENTMRLGGEIWAVPWLRLFIGGQRDLTPQPTTTLSPTLPDSSSWSLGGGAALDLVPFLSLFAAYQYTWFDKVTTTGADAFPATYESNAQIGSVGAQFRWF
jgi:long-chain fatty acid transport protein